MKVKLLMGVQLEDGKVGKKGSVVDVREGFARQMIGSNQAEAVAEAVAEEETPEAEGGDEE